MKKILLLSIFTLALTASCKKSTTTPEPEPVPTPAPAAYVNRGFQVYLCDVSNISIIPLNISFRTSSGNELTDSVVVASTNPFIGTRPCGDQTAGTTATLKIKNQAAYKLEVFGTVSSQRKLLASFSFNSDGTRGASWPGTTPSPAIGYFQTPCGDMLVGF